MFISTSIMAIFAIVLSALAIRKKDGTFQHGLQLGTSILIKVAPLIALSFIIVGMMQVLIPEDIISEWVGTDSGIKGIVLGTLLGGLMPGGPFTSLPIAVGLLQTGAGIGTMVAFVTGWSLLAFSRLPLEIGLLGWRFSAARLSVVFFMPVIGGLLADFFFSDIILFD